MKKIPLEATLAGAYRFLFTRIISIIGTIWLPFVAMSALVAGILYLVVPHAWWSGNFPNPDGPRAVFAVLQPVLVAYPLIFLIGLIGVSIMLAGLMRHALGRKTTTTFVYFSFGAPVWRMLAALVIADILLILLAIALAMAFHTAFLFVTSAIPHLRGPSNPILWPMYPLQMYIACGVAGHCPYGPGLVGLMVLGVLEFCVFFYAAVRLTFFLPAVVVAEDRIGLGRSWSLGGGNFWRIFLVALMTAIPVAIVVGIASHILVSPTIVAAMTNLPHHHAFFEGMIATFRAELTVLPIVLALSLVQRVAFLGLISGAIGTAYNAVTSVGAPEE
jgi:hypothetical protein